MLFIGIAIGLVAGAAAGALVFRLWLRSRAAGAEHRAALVVEDARREADAVKREAQIEAREHSVKLRAEIDEEVQSRRARIVKIEERVLALEEEVESKQEELTRREQGLSDRETHIRQLQDELKDTKAQELAELQRIAGMTVQEAKQQLLERSEDLVRHELARRVRQMEEEARTDAKRRARNLVADALQRVAASHAAESTVTLVELPSDDMKGRIIGREGRNIRSLEHLTGVDFIIDDTPQAVVLSSFDPIRREVAKLTLSKLIEDGRIHPSRIEEMYYSCKAELEESILQAGRQAVFEANCGEFNEELVKILGRLRFRTSYGQNVLKHSLEVVHLAGIMAAELEAGVRATKRAALLHDLGKAMTHEVEGSHAAISTQLARRARRVGRRLPRDRGTPLRGAAADGRGGAPDRGRRDLRLPAGRAEARAWRATSAGSSRSRSWRSRSAASRRSTPSRRAARSASWSSRARWTTTAPSCSRTRSRARSRTSSSTRDRSRSRSSARAARWTSHAT